jgi:hypothetical protein
MLHLTTRELQACGGIGFTVNGLLANDFIPKWVHSCTLQLPSRGLQGTGQQALTAASVFLLRCAGMWPGRLMVATTC